MKAENVLIATLLSLRWFSCLKSQIFNCFYLAGSADRLISRFSVLLVNRLVFIFSFLASWWTPGFQSKMKVRICRAFWVWFLPTRRVKKKTEIKNLVGVDFTIYFHVFASLTSELLRTPRVRLDRLVCTLSLHRVHIPHFLQVFLCPNRPDYLRCTALIFGCVEVDFLRVF